MAYDAFLSYCHDSEVLATALQDGLLRFSKPWYRRAPFVRVFRDATGFGAGHDLGDQITAALDSAGHLVLVLSPEAAKSPRVDKEVAHFLKTPGRENVTFVVEE